MLPGTWRHQYVFHVFVRSLSLIGHGHAGILHAVQLQLELEPSSALVAPKARLVKVVVRLHAHDQQLFAALAFMVW